MPTSNSSVNGSLNNGESSNSNNDSEVTINQDACEKYGITLSEPPTEPVEPYSRYNEDDTVYGFVTEVSHDQKGTEVEIKDWGYCLEDTTIELGFQNMHRSRVMEEVIKSYGLVPIVNLTGLRDDKITWNNSTSKSSQNEGGNMTGAGTGSASIDEAVDNAIRGITDPLQKAKAIDSAFKGYIYYKYYEDCHYANDLDGAWKDANINCADGANVMCAMFLKGGLDSTIFHTSGHYIVRVVINGTNYFTDNAAVTGSHTTRPFGQVWGDDPSTGTEVGTRITA